MAASRDSILIFLIRITTLWARGARSERGLLARPTVAEVYGYCATVDAEMHQFLEHVREEVLVQLGTTVVLGLHHEQQHQELILTDLKHLFSRNPLRPVYREQEPTVESPAARGTLSWVAWPAGLRRVGHEGKGFAFDNEWPRHTVYLEAFRLADRLVTNGEYLAFMADSGYALARSLALGRVDRRRAGGWVWPLYWEESAAGWRIMTLAGMGDLAASEPVSTSASTRPTPWTPHGPAGFRPKPNGKSLRRKPLPPPLAQLSRERAVHPASGRQPPGSAPLFPNSSSVMSGSGPRVPTPPIAAIGHSPVLWASTTVSSCATSTCSRRLCARPARTSGRRTATSFPLTRDGSSRESGSPRIFESSAIRVPLPTAVGERTTYAFGSSTTSIRVLAFAESSHARSSTIRRFWMRPFHRRGRGPARLGRLMAGAGAG